MKPACEIELKRRLAILGLCLQTCVGLEALVSPRASAQAFDSATSACRQNPALCVQKVGEEPGVLGAPQGVTGAGISLGSLGMAIGPQLQRRVERALMECADLARSQVLLERRQGQSPSKEECNRVVSGTSITLAMQLGQEMHQVAARCAGEKLAQLIPGKFSLEPRYRYDPAAKETIFISEEDAQRLLQQGRSAELKGTLRPDVVVHSGDPLRAQAVYDFKFGCAGDLPGRWTEYQDDSTLELKSQKALYVEALHTVVLRVIPRWGLMP